MVADVPLKLRGELREGQLFIVDQLRIPNRVEVGRLAKPGDLHVIPAFVAAFADVERLMKVTDEMNHEPERQLLVGDARFGILEHGAEMGQRLQRVALGRRMIVYDAVHRDVVPGGGRLLPESTGRRAHLVGPVRCFVQALGTAEDLAHVRSREPAELGVGNGGNDSVPGLAPGKCRRWNQARRGGNEQPYFHRTGTHRLG